MLVVAQVIATMLPEPSTETACPAIWLHGLACSCAVRGDADLGESRVGGGPRPRGLLNGQLVEGLGV